MNPIIRICFVWLCLLSIAGGTAAQQGVTVPGAMPELFVGQLPRAGAVRDGRVEAELVAAQTAAVPGDTLLLGLRLKMDEGWHTYWKNPGDSGLATSIEWDLPAGFVAHDIDWPAPHYFEVSGLASYAYEGEIVLPVRIDVPDDLSGEQITFRATADWLVCKEQCEPGKATLMLTLPVVINPSNVLADSKYQALFDEAQARQPKPLRDDAATAMLRDGAIRLVVTDTAFASVDDSTQTSVRFFPEDPMVIDMTAPQTFSPSDYAGISVSMQPNAIAASPPERLRGVLAYRHGEAEYFYAIDVPISDDPLRDVADGE